ncbi:MAG: hypothetical protein ABFS32_05845 [Bacteroidota bacterium]
MDIIENWQDIRAHFRRSFRSNFHVSVASLTADGNPTVTPIGSMFLNDDQTGFYFEKYPEKLPRYAGVNKKICVLGVNSNSLFWIKSLFRRRFSTYPGLRLYGELGSRRKATDKETKRLNRRMKATKGLKGNTYLWGKMKYVREVKFTSVEKVNLGKMTKSL